MEILVPNYLPDESNRAYAERALRMNIMTLRLKPGAALNEGELAERFHMSRTPIHEAISSLRDEWLVEVFPQRGTRVSHIDPALVKEGYNARLLLESELLRDEAGKLSRSQAQMILDGLRKQEQVAVNLPEDVDALIQLDDDFHRMMYFFGGRAHTWQAIRGLVSHYDRLRYLDALEGNLDFAKVLAQHREFCDYLLLGLPTGVDPVQKLADHLTSFRGDLLNKLDAHPDYFTITSPDGAV